MPWGSKPQRVKGLVDAWKVRIVWDAGTLFVFTGPNVVYAFDAPEIPGKVQGKWHLTTDEGSLDWTQQGCPSCGWWGKGSDAFWIAKGYELTDPGEGEGE